MAKKSELIKQWDGFKFKLYIAAPNTKAKTHLYFNYPNPATGKNEVIRNGRDLTGKLTQKELYKNAEILADSYIDLLREGWSPFNPTEKKVLTSTSSISDCITHYLTIRKTEYDNDAISKNRYDSINIVLGKWFTEWLKKNNYQFRKPSSFTYTDFKNFFDTYIKARRWGKETQNTYRDVIKMFYIFLKEEKVVDDYFAIAKIEYKNTRNDSTHFKIFQEDELELVNKLVRADKAYFNLFLGAKLLYNYNIRLEEQLKFQIEDYDYDTKILTLPADKTKNGEEARFQLSGEEVKLLEDHIEGYPKKYYIYGKSAKPDVKRFAYGYFGQKWRKFREQYNIPDRLKIYALKHSSSFYALDDGVPIPELQKRLRHVLESTTRRYQKGLEKAAITSVKDSRF